MVRCTALVFDEAFAVAGSPDDWMAEVNAWPSRWVKIADAGYFSLDHLKAIRPTEVADAKGGDLISISDVFEKEAL